MAGKSWRPLLVLLTQIVTSLGSSALITYIHILASQPQSQAGQFIEVLYQLLPVGTCIVIMLPEIYSH